MGQEGVNQVLDELLSCGTVSLDRVAFQKALDNIGANESAGTDFSLEVPASDFDRGVALLAENELHPALPASAFKIVKRQLVDSMAGELQSPAYLTQHALESALLPKNDPDLRCAHVKQCLFALACRRPQLLPARVSARPDYDSRYRKRHAGTGPFGD